jgi:hypothetical protein
VDAMVQSEAVNAREELAQCEQVIQAGLQSFVDVGRALLTIRDNHLRSISRCL